MENVARSRAASPSPFRRRGGRGVRFHCACISPRLITNSRRTRSQNPPVPQPLSAFLRLAGQQLPQDAAIGLSRIPEGPFRAELVAVGSLEFLQPLRRPSAQIRFPRLGTAAWSHYGLRMSWGRSSAGRARRSQCRGREFDPPRLHSDFNGLNQDRLTPGDSPLRGERRLPSTINAHPSVKQRVPFRAAPPLHEMEKGAGG